MINTKDSDNKYTLLHFLIKYVEREFPETLNFYDDLLHVDEASRFIPIFNRILQPIFFTDLGDPYLFFRISFENVQKLLKQMDNSIKNLETDLKNSQRTNLEPDDRWEVHW